jgi:hypothetical protein
MFNFKKENLHHAYLLEGDKEALRMGLFEFIEKDLKHQTQGNPNFWFGEFDAFTIDDARALKELQMNKVDSDEKKIFVITFNYVTREAQNGMLKIFEEPTENTHFFVVVPSIATILPTLLSRVIHINNFSESGVKNPMELLADKFVKGSRSEKGNIVKELLAQITDEERSKFAAAEFVDHLQKKISSLIDLHNTKEKDIQVLESLFKSRDYLNDRSASAKMILEHLALTI